MEKCFCIVIDDSSQILDTATFNTIKENVKNSASIDLELIQLNPKSEEMINEEDGSILLDKVIERLNTPDYLKRQIHLIICDYELGDEKVNGFEIIRLLRNNLGSKKEIILYSSNIENVIDKIINKEEDKAKSIKDLVSSKIFDFCLKDEHLSSAIIKAMKSEMDFSSDKFLEAELFKYPDLKFNNIYDRFEGKTLGEIAVVMSSNLDEGNRLKKEMISQVVAYMINPE
ncbi:MAG: hypothetical protein EOO90_20650 [Pedobacter sp.]|nr:MAG: hypothetical protein EOO90_20650 [Pedobacter sp.]